MWILKLNISRLIQNWTKNFAENKFAAIWNEFNNFLEIEMAKCWKSFVWRNANEVNGKMGQSNVRSYCLLIAICIKMYFKLLIFNWLAPLTHLLPPISISVQIPNNASTRSRNNRQEDIKHFGFCIRFKFGRRDSKANMKKIFSLSQSKFKPKLNFTNMRTNQNHRHWLRWIKYFCKMSNLVYARFSFTSIALT